jgi:UPF0271 protein
MSSIDLNADLGEGAGSDDDLLAIVSSASIACGGHAGDSASIRHALKACKARGIRVGAHPGYADRVNFGRVRLDMPRRVLMDHIRDQMFLIRHIASETGTDLAYVKLHGALANEAAENLDLALELFATIQNIDPALAILALDNSRQVEAASALGQAVIREAYADRAYLPDGMLAPRSMAGAVIHDLDAVVEQCLRLALDGEIIALDGTVLKSEARSICLHGDTPGAVDMAREVREALADRGVAIKAD